MTTYLPSDRAQKYARSLHYKGIPPVEIAAEGFDAGLAAAASDALATVTPRTLTTAAELDALPNLSVVLDADRDAWQKRNDEWQMVGCEGIYSASHVFSDTDLRDPVTLLIPEPAPEPAPAPVRLTDPDDPRIKDGALVRAEYDHDAYGTSVVEGLTRHAREGGFIGTRIIGGWGDVPLVSAARLYLIAEAPEPPDPDADRKARIRDIILHADDLDSSVRQIVDMMNDEAL